MANQPRTKRVRSLHSLVQVGGITGVTKAMEQVFQAWWKRQEASIPARHLLQMWQKQTPENTGLQSFGCRGCGKKGHFEKVCLKAKHSTHSLKVPQASTSSAGAGASEPLYFEDDGQPIFTHMVSVPHANKHLIKFPIALDYITLRSQIGDSTTPPQTVLLKADTGADVNLMNRQMFSQLFVRPRCCN